MPNGYPARARAIAAPGWGPRYQPVPTNPARPATPGHGNIRPGRVLRLARKLAASQAAVEAWHMAEYAWNVHFNPAVPASIPGMLYNGWTLVTVCTGAPLYQQTGLATLPAGCLPNQALAGWATPAFGAAISVSGTGARWLRAYSRRIISPSGDPRFDQSLGFQKPAGTTVSRGPVWVPGVQVIPVPGTPGRNIPGAPPIAIGTGAWPWASWDPYAIPVAKPGATPLPIPWALVPYKADSPARSGASEGSAAGYGPGIIYPPLNPPGGGVIYPPVNPPVNPPGVVDPPWVDAPTVTVSPGVGVRASARPHAVRAPYPGEKEIKARFLRDTRPLRLIMDASTESADVIEALWRALPRSCQTRVKGIKTSIGQKGLDVYKCWDHMDATRMLKELARNEIIDFIWGNEDPYVKWFNRRFGLLSSGAAFEAVKDFDWDPDNDESSYNDAFGNVVSPAVGSLLDYIFGP